MSIRHEFEKWIANLERLKLPVVDMLLPGLNSAYIRSELARIGLDCSEDIVELYNVCGGVGPRRGVLLNQMWMYGSHYLLPFDRAISNYGNFSGDARWNASWFPVFGNDGGDFYSVCSLKARDDWEMIAYFMVNTGEESQIRFSSLLNMLVVINECFDQDVCFLDDRGNLGTKFFEASLIAMRHNKNLPFYQ
ncbi:MAG TPA: hypothetical protein VG166_02160 [Caulobacteraceae bacterium]|jgi:hypothetical protein|nr:hypothetical protein [Caulobacteraceae bacterium]